jgi:hypothetical protein
LVFTGGFFLFIVFVLGFAFPIAICTLTFRLAPGSVRFVLLPIFQDPLLNLCQTIVYSPTERHLLLFPFPKIDSRMGQEVVDRFFRLRVEISCYDDRPVAFSFDAGAERGTVGEESTDEEESLAGPFVGVLRVPEPGWRR